MSRRTSVVIRNARKAGEYAKNVWRVVDSMRTARHIRVSTFGNDGGMSSMDMHEPSASACNETVRVGDSFQNLRGESNCGKCRLLVLQPKQAPLEPPQRPAAIVSVEATTMA